MARAAAFFRAANMTSTIGMALRLRSIQAVFEALGDIQIRIQGK